MNTAPPVHPSCLCPATRWPPSKRGSSLLCGASRSSSCVYCMGAVFLLTVWTGVINYGTGDQDQVSDQTHLSLFTVISILLSSVTAFKLYFSQVYQVM